MTQQFQRASKANVHALPPPKMTPAQKQEVVTGMTEGEKRLLKAEKSASLHKGLLLGIVPGIVFGVVLTLISTTSLIDQVGAIWTTRSISERMAE